MLVLRVTQVYFLLCTGREVHVEEDVLVDNVSISAGGCGHSLFFSLWVFMY